MCSWSVSGGGHWPRTRRRRKLREGFQAVSPVQVRYSTPPESIPPTTGAGRGKKTVRRKWRARGCWGQFSTSRGKPGKKEGKNSARRKWRPEGFGGPEEEKNGKRKLFFLIIKKGNRCLGFGQMRGWIGVPGVVFHPKPPNHLLTQWKNADLGQPSSCSLTVRERILVYLKPIKGGLRGVFHVGPKVPTGKSVSQVAFGRVGPLKMTVWFSFGVSFESTIPTKNRYFSLEKETYQGATRVWLVELPAMGSPGRTVSNAAAR